MASKSISLFALLALGCGAAPIRHFPAREPMLADDDTQPWKAPCGPDAHDPKKLKCTPPEYVSPFVWDGVDAMLFHPVTRFLAVDPHRESVNVNALDEVPDSSWYQNRITRQAMTPDEIAEGSCGDAKIDPEDPDGAWVIDQGKANGANPGFRIRTASGARFLLKTDEKDHPERATGATAIATRIYHAAGYWTGCDQVVYARKSVLQLTPNLVYSDNTGIKRPFGDKDLAVILNGAARRGDKYRFVASKWLEGKPLGPFTYEGVRKDDLNDVVPHQDRRELRGQRVLAAWLGHFDAREQNSMTTWMTRRPDDEPDAPGHIKHWLIDFNDCFGSEWDWDPVTKRLGFSYYFDAGDIATDYLTFGIPERPWDRLARPALGNGSAGSIFGYFEADHFEPEGWKPGYQNPAFLRMSELDAAWMARIIARFTPEDVAKLVAVGDFTEPQQSDYLTRTLLARQRKILRRWLSVASPIADFELHGASLCGVDLARKSGAWEETAFRYSAREVGGASLATTPLLDGRVCVALPPSGYAMVELANGVAARPVRVHVTGGRVVGVER